MKYALFLLSLVAIALAVVGYTQVLGELGPATAQCVQYLNTDPARYQQCLTTGVQQVLTTAGSAQLLIGGALFLDVVVWIMGLVWTARNRRWGWFIAIFLLAPLTTLLYSLFGPDGSIFRGARARAGAANANAPGFATLPASVRPGMCWQCGGRVKLDSRICLNCGATQSNYEVGPSAATQASGFNSDATASGYAPAWQPAPAAPAGWTPPPSGYQQPGQPPAMVPDYQQPGYAPPGYAPPGYQQPGQPPAPGGPGWGQGY